MGNIQHWIHHHVLFLKMPLDLLAFLSSLSNTHQLNMCVSENTQETTAGLSQVCVGKVFHKCRSQIRVCAIFFIALLTIDPVTKQLYRNLDVDLNP